MRVGVDIDGVLADTLPLWVGELNKHFNKNKKVEEIHLYDLLETFELENEQLRGFIREKGQDMMSAPAPIPGAAHYLKKIKEEHYVVIVTARQELYREATEGWLERHSMRYDELLLTGTHEKADICREQGLQIMIEDTREVGLGLSVAGIPVLLLDAPYNRRPLPELVTRVYNWEDIYHKIKSLSLD
jgi:uncharacterized HAD superfamily protein